MTLAHKYDIAQRVRLAPLECEARVQQIRFDSRGIHYLVTYWWEGDQKEVWVDEDDLEA